MVVCTGGLGTSALPDQARIKPEMAMIAMKVRACSADTRPKSGVELRMYFSL